VERTDEPGPRVRLIERFDPLDDFDFRRFRMRHMAAELLRTGLVAAGAVVLRHGCSARDARA
jgi:hypothetical protein